jgi:ERCC4-type nuclease
MKIVVDTREQRPLRFPPRIKTVRRRLVHGDYSLDGHSAKGIVVERKSHNDFFGSFTRGRKEMYEKMLKMGKRYHRAYLVVESPVSDVLDGSRYSRIDGGWLLGAVMEICARTGVVPLFCDDSEAAARAVLQLFDVYHSLTVDPQAIGVSARKDSSFESRQKRVYGRRDTT